MNVKYSIENNHLTKYIEMEIKTSEETQKFANSTADAMAKEILTQGVETQKLIVAGIIIRLSEANKAEGERHHETAMQESNAGDIRQDWANTLDKMKG